MARRRLFSLDVIDTDRFLDLPISSQSLYFHLGMRADDDGFVSSPKKVCSIANCSADDIKILIAKGFIIGFESGIIVITDWNINNTIRKDRHSPTKYINEYQRLTLSETGIYYLDNQAATVAQPNGNHAVDSWLPQYNISKDNLIKDKIDTLSSDDDCRAAKTDYQSVIDSFNSVCTSLPQVKTLNDNRKKAIKSALKTYDLNEIFKKVEQSDFLSGRNGSWTGCCFDWIIKPSNLVKIHEGNYADNKAHTADYYSKSNAYKNNNWGAIE